MKHYISYFVAAGIMMLAATACKEKVQKEEIIVTKYVPQKPKAPIRMNPDLRRTDVSWLGRNYVIKIERIAVDSLPMVSDDTGQKYVDNRISLFILRSDSTVFMHKTFTKSSFSSHIDADFRQHGVLENIVFHEVEGNELNFVVIVTHPDADDEFVPLKLSIDAQGGMNIEQKSLLDDEREDLSASEADV